MFKESILRHALENKCELSILVGFLAQHSINLLIL